MTFQKFAIWIRDAHLLDLLVLDLLVLDLLVLDLLVLDFLVLDLLVLDLLVRDFLVLDFLVLDLLVRDFTKIISYYFHENKMNFDFVYFRRWSWRRPMRIWWRGSANLQEWKGRDYNGEILISFFTFSLRQGIVYCCRLEILEK